MIGTYYYRSIGRSESQGVGTRVQGLLKEKGLLIYLPKSEGRGSLKLFLAEDFGI